MGTKSILIVLLIMLGANLFAQKGKHIHGRHSGVVRIKQTHRYHGGRQAYRARNFVVVKRRHIHTVAVLPIGYATIVFKRRPYYYYGGLYYRNIANAYTLVPAPLGLRIKVLPLGYRRIALVGGGYHYYYQGVYYREVDSVFETTEPKTGTIVPELPADNVEEITLNGQTYYEYDKILYKTIVTEEGLKYEVAGKLEK